MKHLIAIVIGSLLIYSITSCRSTKKLQTAVNKKDTPLVVRQPPATNDSLKVASDILHAVEKNRIDFKTF